MCSGARGCCRGFRWWHRMRAPPALRAGYVMPLPTALLKEGMVDEYSQSLALSGSFELRARLAERRVAVLQQRLSDLEANLANEQYERRVAAAAALRAVSAADRSEQELVKLRLAMKQQSREHADRVANLAKPHPAADFSQQFTSPIHCESACVTSPPQRRSEEVPSSVSVACMTEDSGDSLPPLSTPCMAPLGAWAKGPPVAQHQRTTNGHVLGPLVHSVGTTAPPMRGPQLPSVRLPWGRSPLTEGRRINSTPKRYDNDEVSRIMPNPAFSQRLQRIRFEDDT